MENLQIDSWMKDIDPDMLPEPYRRLSKSLGVETAIKLAMEYQGTTVYFAKLDGFIKTIRNSRIREEFDGSNTSELAIKYNLTEVWIRQILADIMPDERQGSLF